MSDDSETDWDTDSWTLMTSPRKAVAFERDRGSDNPPRVYVRIWSSEEDRWLKRSLGITVRDGNGDIDSDEVTPMLEYAKTVANELLAEVGSDVTLELDRSAPRPDLTLEEGFRLALRPKDVGDGGKYSEGRYKEDVERAVKDIRRVLDPSRTWASLHKRDYERLWEAVADVRMGEEVWRSDKIRAEDCDPEDEFVGMKRNPGYSWALEMTKHLVAIGRWLQDRKHLPLGTLDVPSHWKSELKTTWQELTNESTDPEKPRYSPEEHGRLLRALPNADPRIRLALTIGAELRLGQVRRTRRSHLSLEPVGAFDAGRVTVVGRGKKSGVTIDLTPEEREVIDLALGYTDAENGNARSGYAGPRNLPSGASAYLADLEEAYQAGERDDFPLFPQNVYRDGTPTAAVDVPSKPMSASYLRELFLELEDLAGVEHRDGRASYGLRRSSTDEAPEVVDDDRVLDNLGGWADTRTREDYQARQNPKVSAKAARARREIRNRVQNVVDRSDEERGLAAEMALDAEPSEFGSRLNSLAERDAPTALEVLEDVAENGLNGSSPTEVFKHMSPSDLIPLVRHEDPNIRKPAAGLLARLD